MKKLTRREMLRLMGCGAAGAALAGCAAPAPSAPTATPVSAAAPAAAPLVVVTFVESWFGVPQFADSIKPVTEAISKKMQSEGLNIEIRSMLLDDHEAKYPVLYASGADFTCAFDAPWYKMSSLIQQGALLPLEALFAKYGSSLTQSIGAEIVDFNYMVGPDGTSHLFGIPVRYYYSGTTGVVIREDLRKKYGAPEPTSEGGYASLEPYLQAIKENEPNMIPFANRPAYPMTDGNGWTCARRSFGGWGVGLKGITISNIFEGTTFVNSEETECFQEAAALCRSWYEKGYLPREAIAADYNVLTDYFNVQKTACFQENEPEYKDYEEGLAIAKAVAGAEAKGYDLSGMRAGKKGLGNLKQWNFVVFNANAPEEQQVAGIQYFNWLTASQDNADLWLMGIDGVNYKKEPDVRFSEVPGTDPTRNYRRQWYVSGIGGKFQRQSVDLPEDNIEALKFYTATENFVFTPYEKFDVSTKEIETEMSAIDAAYKEAYFGIATGSVPMDQAIATFKQMLDDAGRPKVKEWFQKKIDAWTEENKDYIKSFKTGL